MSIFATLKNTAAGLLGKGALVGMKYGPHLMTGAGLIGFGVSMFLVYKETRELDAVLAEGDSVVEKVHARRKELDLEAYPEEVYQKHLTVAHTRKVMNVVKLYGPSIGLGFLSAAFVLSSHGIMTKRNYALIAAYKAIDLGFKKYRTNVIKEFGPEKDEEFRFGKKEPHLEREVIVTDGNNSLVEERVVGGMETSDFARWYDRDSKQFRHDPIHGLNYVTCVQNHMNDRVNIRGFVTLNEVYEDLGFKPIPEGQYLGWWKDGPNGKVDFGLDSPRNRDFVSGYASEALLDFNIEGVVYDHI